MTATADDKPFVRWMIRNDMRAVLDIEKDSFTVPWTEAEFRSFLQQRTSIGMVIEVQGTVVGFMLYTMSKSDFQIDSIAVATNSRRQGLATLLINKLLAKRRMGEHRGERKSVSAIVRESNLRALKMFRTLGFVCTEMLRRPYQKHNIDEDGYRMVASLEPAQHYCLKNRFSTTNTNSDT